MDDADAARRPHYIGTAIGRPPRPRRRVLPLLVALNLLVWVLWQIAQTKTSSTVFMLQNFTVSAFLLEQGRVWTLLTSAFSQTLTLHLMVNMVVLWSFGSIVEMRWGARRFCVFYLCSAVFASAAHVFVSYVGWPDVPAQGASGAVAAVLVAFVFLYPRHLILLLFFIPLPAWIGLLLFVALDIWGLVAQHGGGGLPIGHGAHLGGALFGAIWCLVDRRRRPDPWRRDFGRGQTDLPPEEGRGQIVLYPPERERPPDGDGR